MDIYKLNIVAYFPNANNSKILCLTCGAIVGVSIRYFMKKNIIRKLTQFYNSKRSYTGQKNQSLLVNKDFNMTEANFKYTFNNLSHIRRLRKDVFSPEIWIGELPWKIMLRPTRLCLESHMICSEIYCSWSCCVHLELSLMGRNPRKLALDDELYEADSQNEFNRNMGQDVPWEEILDPENLYIHDDSITFQVMLKVETLEKISWSDKSYLMDEQANTLVKKYKTNMDILRQRIKQLSKRNKQLETDIKLLKMYKNSNFL